MAADDQGVDHHGGSVLLDRSFDLGTLSATRRAVLGSFPADDLAQERAQAFLAAINEGMINAIQHGGGGGNATSAGGTVGSSQSCRTSDVRSRSFSHRKRQP